MPELMEVVRSGQYADGWDDITCVGTRYQEQIRAGKPNEFRHRPIVRQLIEYCDGNTMKHVIVVDPATAWIAGPSPDGCGKSFDQS